MAKSKILNGEFCIRQLSFRHTTNWKQIYNPMHTHPFSFLTPSLPHPSHIFSLPHSFNTHPTLFSSSLLPSLQNSLDDIVTSYELQIELQNNIRNRRNDGNQTLTDLSMFPRLRLTGASTITILISGVLVGFEQPSYSTVYVRMLGSFRFVWWLLGHPSLSP